MSFWKREVLPMREEFARRFPKLFTPKGAKDRTKKPLKIGIHEDLFKEFPEVAPKTIRLALFDYIQGPKYLKACYDGAKRYDLEGNEVGEVTRENRMYLLRLEEQNQRHFKMRMKNAKPIKQDKTSLSKRDIPENTITILDV